MAFDDYELENELGRGGMGRVSKAKQKTVHNRPVALKEVLVLGPEQQARFKIESEAMAKLRHPNIVEIYEVGRLPNGAPFFSMAYVDGGTLAENIAGAP